MQGHGQHFFHFFKNRELNEMYLSISIRAFAISLVGIFVPLFFYSHGLPLAAIFLFYALQSAVHILFSIPAAKISSRFGIKHSIILSIPLLITFLMLMYSFDTFHWPLYLLALFAGMSTAFFWIPYHIDFAKFTDKKSPGKQIAFSGFVASIFSAAGPLLGGLLLVVIGFKALFIFASALLFVSVVPLFFSKDVHQPSDFTFKEFFKKQEKRDVISFLSHGMENKMNGIVWPLFLFIFVFRENYAYLGVASTLTMCVALFSTLLVSKFTDLHRRAVFKFGSGFSALVWFARSFVITPIQAFFTEAFYGASNTAMHIPFDSMNYEKAKARKITPMILQREIYHHLGVIIMLLALALLTGYLSETFRFGGPLSSLLRLFF